MEIFHIIVQKWIRKYSTCPKVLRYPQMLVLNSCLQFQATPYAMTIVKTKQSRMGFY